ncbi:tetratricopeptide repeat protein [Nitratidesulfovibrio vulgaris]|jgi:cytochrome c-type biogenesis protein CcmH/NrfG|uniref:Uncharacterized protein n=1 Tax=Nitratidesulfovibrio vulgaris (strain ATCC 29579 / DSM 644 / CCUG 34227 / NCIMB 8303 / VKM B-1760 / Hildenborough) TaxID=882 RepID=Q72D84_NITV2|nr:tetratricopeptide repeat protein [Nitratidesulfovibrio vulgaris]AAS95525.1 hypothetical protein DVU_1045 [Nitratidesulfovibrio vulgaris str. Hildenborough]ADP86128.1 TPR repeat-containing protein [Nitratidesulfovibrio vulgaris RCH1]
MTDTRNAPPAAMPDGPRKAILAVMGLSLLVMLGGSFLYRLNHPGLVVEGRQQPPAATQGPSEAEVLGPMMQRLQQNPNDLEALVFLGEHFLGHEDWARAEAFLQRAVIAAPTEGRPLYLLGIAQYHREQFAPAAETFERLLAINDEPAARYNLGLLYLHYLNDKPKALQHLKAVVAAKDAPEELRKRAGEELAKATGN